MPQNDYQLDPKEIDEVLKNSELMTDDERSSLEKHEEVVLLTSGGKVTALEQRQGYRFALLHQRYDFRQVAESLVVREKRSNRGYRALSEGAFHKLVYTIAPETLPSDARALYQKMVTMAPAFTSLNTIRLGNKVWDTETAELHELDLSPDSTSPYAPQNILWYSPYTPTKTSREVEEYLLSLANGNEAVVEDIVSSIAVTFLAKKPRGVFWWIGTGANGKSVLMELIQEYLFPHQVSNVGMKQLESGRGVGEFNSKLLNVSTEALGDGVVEDATNYKNLGAHEPFSVRQLYHDSYLPIRGGVNCIYAVNAFPEFKEKNEAITSRTKIIEFTNHFEGQPNFKEDTFTPEFVAAFLGRVLVKAREIYEAGGLLVFSDTTMESMEDFAQESNPSRTFLEQVGFVGFKRVKPVYDLYRDWHQTRGIIANIATFREFSSAVRASRFKKRPLSWDKTVQPYFLPHITADEVRVLMNRRPSEEVYYADEHARTAQLDQLDILIQEAEKESHDESNREW